MSTERENTGRILDTVADLNTFLENSRIVYEEMGELSTVFANLDTSAVNHEGLFTGLIGSDDGVFTEKRRENTSALLNDNNFERVLDELLLEGDTAGMYLKEMAKTSLLTHEQEVFLAKRIEIGREAKERMEVEKEKINASQEKELNELITSGAEARDYLIKANTRLVVNIAKIYTQGFLQFLDLVQEGNLGLIQAVKKFDHRKGYKFSTYATPWIRQKITRSIADQSRTIRLPVYLHYKVNRLYNITDGLKQELGRTPEPSEIAEIMELDVDQVVRMMRISQIPLSLEDSIDEEGETELIKRVEDMEAPSPSEIAERSMLREQIANSLSALEPRAALIISLRYGLMDGYSYTLEDTGNMLKLTKAQVKKIERASLRYLSNPARSYRLRNFL